MNHTYHQIQSGLEMIKYIKDFIKMSDANRRKLFEHRNGYHYVNRTEIDSDNPHISRNQIVSMLRAAGNVLGNTHDLRGSLKHRTEYMFVHNMAMQSQNAFQLVIINNLELNDLLCRVVHNGGPYELRAKEFFRGRRNMEVTIPSHWNKTVYDRGLHIVNATDGPRAVISATKKKVGRLNDMNIQVFKGQAMGFKKRLKKYWLHDAWIMKMEAEDNVITALHEDFTKAEQLINRRIRKAVTEALNV